MKDLVGRLEWLNDTETIEGLHRILKRRDFEKASERPLPETERLLYRSISRKIHSLSPTRPGFKEELERLDKDLAREVIYGFTSVGEISEDLKEILGELTDWEKVYFLVGAWTEREETAADKDVTEIVYDYIKAGASRIYTKQTQRGGEELPGLRTYSFGNTPSRDERHGELAERFEELLEEEKLLKGTGYEEDALEATAVFLDRCCSESELRYLTEKYGRDVMGEYAIPSKEKLH